MMVIQFNVQEIGNPQDAALLGTGSIGSETAEDVTTANIHHERVLFHNSVRIKKVITDLTFKKIE
ncbi:hypothetical protein [Sphingobacterium sp. SGR-19]|uniref:hypothetical protein n=1 Tax=Sphingobacterium sp. SGR-19 TaxID=2710886 RepID=UPI0013EC5D7A|nr:hypothetical protein [Sphingobacterium sp. SGR-19]NGM66144.1 hypothetical protein [Sphingobacterium sp. SGR-19]